MRVFALLALAWFLVSPAMAAEVTHYVKLDTTTRSTSNQDTLVEETNWTIAWSDLTTAGFAASDDVIILVKVVGRADQTNDFVMWGAGFGTTFAGWSPYAESLVDQESSWISSGVGQHYLFIERHTLVTSENLYFGIANDGSGTTYFDEFACIIIGLDDLTSNDFLYAETTPSGDASTTYTDGASTTTPAAGDWLLFATSFWQDDSVTAHALMQIVADTSSVSEVEHEGEDVGDAWSIGTIAYRAALGASKTVKVQYRADTATTQDCESTKIFGLRLDAFEDYYGAHTTSTFTHTVLDTWQEYAGDGSYSKVSTGNVLAFGFPITDVNETNNAVANRIQLAGADWDTSSRNVPESVWNAGSGGQRGHWGIGYASVSSGTLDWDFDTAEGGDIAPNTASTEQVATVFSLELDGGAPPACTNFIALMGVGCK